MTPATFKALRAKLKLSTKTLGIRLKPDSPIAERTIRRWESGKKEIPDEVAARLREIATPILLKESKMARIARP